MSDEKCLNDSIMSDALKEADKVSKKQKTCAAKTSGMFYKLIHDVEQCIKQISDASDPQKAIEEMASHIEQLDPIPEMTSETKELHGAVSKLSKTIEKSFSLDVCGALRDVPLDKHTLNTVVAQHLYHEGLFDIGDSFCKEAEILNAEELKAPYATMHQVLAELENKNLAPAVSWVTKHSSAMSSQLNSPENSENSSAAGQVTDLEFLLHRLAFLQALHSESSSAALRYAQQYFPPFQKSHLLELQRLMGALCCVNKVKSHKKCEKRYSSYFDDSLWKHAAVEFKKQCCALLGQAQNSPLLITIAAGAAALPTLLKLASVVAKTQPTAELTEQSNQLPVEVPLGPEFVFHSIFACPVSREQSSPENPPMMLPCGHCMCKQSILLIAKSASRPFKCPYCPVEATTQQCIELHFPDVVYS